MDQIIDLCESLQPGPRGGVGPRGEQGLAGVNAVPADEAVADWIGKDSATQQALAGLKGRWGTHVVFFGDSITAGYLSGGTTFRDVLSRTFGFVNHNYAAGGEGFYHVGKSGGDIANEVANSAKDPSFDHRRVRLAVMMGGVNDIDRNTVKGVDGLKRAVAAIEAEYPNATIVVASGIGGMMKSGYGRLDHRVVGYYDALTRTAMDLGCMTISDAFTWCGYDPDLVEDGLHPNAAGHRMIGARLSNMLAGFPDLMPGRDLSGQLTRSSDADTADLRLHASGRHIEGFIHLWHTVVGDEVSHPQGNETIINVRLCSTPQWMSIHGYRNDAVIGFNGEYNTKNLAYWNIGDGHADMVIRKMVTGYEIDAGTRLDINIHFEHLIA